MPALCGCHFCTLPACEQVTRVPVLFVTFYVKLVFSTECKCMGGDLNLSMPFPSLRGFPSNLDELCILTVKVFTAQLEAPTVP